MFQEILSAAVGAAMPLLYATIGEIYTEKAGNLNLGVEGMMIIGSIIGFTTSYTTKNAALGMLGAFVAGAAAAAIYAFLTISLRSNQVVTGLALTIFGTGFASFFGKPYVGIAAPDIIRHSFRKLPIPFLSKIPVFGYVFFNQDIMVYLSYILVILTYFYFTKTIWGINLTAVGENTSAADASGVAIEKYKYIHTILGGALSGLGGAYLSLVTVPVWQENITNGRGWIAVALVIFASWNSIKAFFGSLLFGGLDILGLRLQGFGITVSQYIIDMLPYLCTIAVLIVSTRKSRQEDMPPESLSLPYFREER